MKNVKEELLLSIIFVGKWLALGLGAVGVLYVAIYFAYHKSYYDPRIEKFDYEISVLQEQKSDLIITKNTLQLGLKASSEQINKLKDSDLPNADNQILKAKKTIKDLGLKWWEKIPVPMLKKDKNIEAAYGNLGNAESDKTAINETLDNLYIEHDKSNKLLSKISDDIRENESEISEIVQDKERFEVDVKGPVIWLASILGLT